MMTEKKNMMDMKTGYGLTFSLSGNEYTPPQISFNDGHHQANYEFFWPAGRPYHFPQPNFHEKSLESRLQLTSDHIGTIPNEDRDSFLRTPNTLEGTLLTRNEEKVMLVEGFEYLVMQLALLDLIIMLSAKFYVAKYHESTSKLKLYSYSCGKISIYNTKEYLIIGIPYNRYYALFVSKDATDEEILNGLAEILKKKPEPFVALRDAKCAEGSIDDASIKDRLSYIVSIISILTA